ncbi:Cthe_2314 family HEPN domain-containing protein [Paenibacillus sp. LHD-117]|uniref:Cthe_2314 family HEPN domain-containing protein n=1 Tax=Paenibacillus sp. LHD-117 TaxID=3071412 RepID=UPI0027E12424|nr:Cthe_2314 family HEPN domain-containing protein [Paenibacillus sp. LHD-117]MDQ6419847.1 Cthe_2314 family HEPN domain-containing protein [Paenibacillus sp. LHD-117]
MLRFMFGETEREPAGGLEETYKLMEQFAGIASARIKQGAPQGDKLRKYEVWARGLRASLMELEQSHYAASIFKERIVSGSVEAMLPEEKLDYDRYVYFDKNAFIRVFSLLDKLGTLLNDMLEMKTERIKPHFSYFTVLRNMRDRNVHPELTWKLNEAKEQCKDAMNRLRKRRNTEIHYMNSEMHDDLIQSQRMYGEEIKLENIGKQAEDLAGCLHMAIESLRLTFRYANSLMRSKSL